MTPATWPREDALAERLLVVDRARGAIEDAQVGDLRSLLQRGDVLVVNDAATLPASFAAHDAAGRSRELRVARIEADETLTVVIFGAGDWRIPTERREVPGDYPAGSVFHLAGGLAATVIAQSPISPRLVRVALDRSGAALWAALYAAGRPVQYAYLARELSLFHVQNRYASRPWAVEMPSAGHALTWELLLALRRGGVVIAPLTHGAGLSSTGDDALDRALPLREPYEIPSATVTEIVRAKREGRRVIAAGTSVVRALEDSASKHGELRAGRADADLLLAPGRPLRVVDGLLTGMHELGASHFSLLGALCPPALLERAYVHAREVGYLGHEFGDASLIV